MKRPLFVFGIFSLIWTVFFLCLFEGKAGICLAFSAILFFVFRFILKNKKAGIVFLSAVLVSVSIILNNRNGFSQFVYSLDNIKMTGTVFSQRETEKGAFLTLYGNAKTKSGKEERITAKVFVKTDNVPKKGEEITITFSPTLSSFESKKLRARGIDFEGTANSYKKTGGKNLLLFNIGKLQRNLKNAIAQNIPGDEGGFALAVFSGDKGLISEEKVDEFSSLGASHIFSVSGIHMGAVFVLSGILSYFSCSRGVFRFVLRVSTLILYSVFAVGGFSIVRAGIMYFLIALSELLSRSYDGKTALGFCALILTLSNPYVIFDIGFMFSFGIVFGINLLYFNVSQKIYYLFKKIKIKSHPFSKEGKFLYGARRYIVSLVSISICGFISAGVLTLFYFKKIYIYSIFASVFVSLSAAAVIYLMPFFILESIILKTHLFASAIKIVSGATIYFIDILAKLPNKEIYIKLTIYFSYAILIFAVYFSYKNLKGAKLKTAFAGAFVSVLLVNAFSFYIENNYFKLKVFDNSAIITGDCGSYLIGSVENDFEGKKISEYLTSQKIDQISLQIMDGFHSDKSQANIFLYENKLVNRVCFKSLNKKYEENLRRTFPELSLKKLKSLNQDVRENGFTIFEFKENEKYNCNFIKIGGVSLLKPTKKCDIILTVGNLSETLPYNNLERIIKHINCNLPCKKSDCELCRKGKMILTASDGALKNAVMVKPSLKDKAVKSIFDDTLIYIKKTQEMVE